MCKTRPDISPTPGPTRRRFWGAVVLSLFLFLCGFCFRQQLYLFWSFITLQLRWDKNHIEFVLSEAHDNFDITFANYSRHQLSADPYPDVVPPILHHITLGSPRGQLHESRLDTVQSCLDLHPGWKVYRWTDDAAAALVADKFPALQDLWEHYRYPIERVNALRYMVLYEYGGIVLDSDLKCRSSLGPLRRFSFVAAEAAPTGLSTGFIMASKAEFFLAELLRNLRTYNMQWLAFGHTMADYRTGAQFASVIHAQQIDRSRLKVLPRSLHNFCGSDMTPIFEYLGNCPTRWHNARSTTVMGSVTNSVVAFCTGLLLGIVIRWRTVLSTMRQ